MTLRVGTWTLNTEGALFWIPSNTAGIPSQINTLFLPLKLHPFVTVILHVWRYSLQYISCTVYDSTHRTAGRPCTDQYVYILYISDMAARRTVVDYRVVGHVLINTSILNTYVTHIYPKQYIWYTLFMNGIQSTQYFYLVSVIHIVCRIYVWYPCILNNIYVLYK